MTWKDQVEIAVYIVGIGTAILSFLQYLRNSKLHRMRWIFDLYSSFYHSADLRKMRMRIDLGQTDFIKKENNPQEMAELDDFLNFFVFVAYLRERKELSDAEIRSMFDYTLKRVAGNSALAEYIGKPEYGYQSLPKMLKEMGYNR